MSDYLRDLRRLVGRGAPRPDGTEILHLRFVARGEWEGLATASWLPHVLRAVFAEGPGAGFAAAAWRPPSG